VRRAIFWLHRRLLLLEADAISRRLGVSPSLTRAVIWQESKGVPVATPEADGTTVYGVMQVKPGTARQMGWGGTDPRELLGVLGVWYGVKYLAWQGARYGGDVRQALSAYNAGTATARNAAYVDAVLAAQERGRA